MFAKITQQDKMHKSLKELAGLALEALPHAALIADRTGAVLLRNAAGRDRLPPGDMLQEALPVEGDSPIRWAEELRAASETPAGVTHRNLALGGAGGRRLTVDVLIRPLPSSDGLALILVEDAAPRVSMERRVSASERLSAAGKLAGRVAHELNNPLDGALRYVGLAARSVEGPARDPLDKARQALERMARVLRELLGEATAPGGQRHPVARLVEEAVSVMGPRAHALGVSIICDLHEGGPTVPGDVFQVFCNVVKNALDAMPAGGTLTIRQRPGERECRVEFADTGGGLDPAMADEIFQPFYTTKPPGEGAGLGLAICREILARMGGTIAAAVRPEGGALVTVALPVEPGDRPANAGE